MVSVMSAIAFQNTDYTFCLWLQNIIKVSQNIFPI